MKNKKNFQLLEIDYHKYYLIKNNITYFTIIEKSKNNILFLIDNYSISYNCEQFSKLTNIHFDSIDKIYEFIINIFESNKVFINDIKVNELIQLNFKGNNQKEFEVILLYNKKSNIFIIKKI